MDHHYKTLEIQPGASQDEIRVAYRKMMLKYHPDKFDVMMKNVNRLLLLIIN